jgi:hypothetical protein
MPLFFISYHVFTDYLIWFELLTKKLLFIRLSKLSIFNTHNFIRTSTLNLAPGGQYLMEIIDERPEKIHKNQKTKSK